MFSQYQVHSCKVYLSSIQPLKTLSLSCAFSVRNNHSTNICPDTITRWDTCYLWRKVGWCTSSVPRRRVGAGSRWWTGRSARYASSLMSTVTFPLLVDITSLDQRRESSLWRIKKVCLKQMQFNTIFIVKISYIKFTSQWKSFFFNKKVTSLMIILLIARLRRFRACAKN